MVQKEVAQRIIAGSGGDYGVLSIMVQFFGEAKITRIVSRKLFYPEPNVDSAVVRIDVRRRDDSIDSQNFLKFVQTCFSMRRKTLVNALVNYNFVKEKALAEEMLTQLELDKNVRGEKLKLEDFAKITNFLSR